MPSPVLAIGGITAGRVREVLAAGAAGVGVISAILAAERPADATRAFLDALGRPLMPDHRFAPITRKDPS